MSDSPGLLFAYQLDRAGGGVVGGWELARADAHNDGLPWLHLDRTHPEVERWLTEESGLDELTLAALLADESRPRSLARGDGLLVDLRGVNLNPGAEADDMISVRMYLTPTRILTLRRRRLRAIEDVRLQVETGEGPTNPGDFLVTLVDALDLRMADALGDLDEQVDSLDERMGSESGSGLRAEISDLRRKVIGLRRYLSPQRDVVSRLATERVNWLTPLHREHLHEIADRTTRRVEDLDSARDRAGVAHEELTGRMGEQMNRTMYVLAIVAAIFLPLGLITGLLGINVGGMPGAEDGSAFWFVTGGLVAIACVQLWLFRKKDWL